MKTKFYLTPFLLLFFVTAGGQDCSTLSLTYTKTESRCVATGTITVNVTGGSGDYNYQAVGPVTTPLTSSNIITGLMPGYYRVLVNDLSTGCTRQQDSIYINGSYNDPRFQLVKTDVSCAGNDGSISVSSQQYGRAPFSYTIIAPSPSRVGETNTTGSFSGLAAGEYLVQLQDSCGGIQVRRITIDNYYWWIQSLSLTRTGCDSASVSVRLRDNRGNGNTAGSAFNGFSYGYVNNGDTSWTSDPDFAILLGTKREAVIVVKDGCGNVQSGLWSLPGNEKPVLDAATLSNFTCTGFTATITGQNLTSPDFCLYDNSGALVACNTTGIFNDLGYGNYCVEAYDACYDTTVTRCFTATPPVPSVGGSVAVSNRGCATFTATVTGQANLTDPEYCLYDDNNVQLACNDNGIFTGIPYGNYCIRISDACTDTIITRCFTVAREAATLTGFGYTGSGCNSFGVQIDGNNLVQPVFCLYDNNGVLITCDSSAIFNNLLYGQYCVRAISCGDTTNSICFSGTRPVPSVAPDVQISQLNCTGFRAAVTGQDNIVDPQYCLHDSTDALVSCNTTGIFENVPYGSYCIKIHNSTICFDTVIIRCLTQLRPLPSVDTAIQVLASGCSNVSFRVNGTNLTDPEYCLYNVSNSLLECNSTGIFNNYPFGRYCVTVHDACIDTTMQVCRTFEPARGITLSTSKSCSINAAYVDVQFTSTNTPFSISLFHPDGTLLHAATTSSNPYRMELPALPVGQYRAVGTDNCGNTDSAFITPDANLVTTATTVQPKCPGSVWENGSGDILATASSNYYGLVPQIIKKNGSVFNQGYSSVDSSTYRFADLEPAQYIVEYTQNSCNGKLYDTITVAPYAYPTQGHSAVFQCDNNSFSLSANVSSGVGPYSYQIIGSIPESPVIASASQSSPLFTINNGTAYSLIRLRTVDACGNATLSDVSVLPLQNFSVRTSDSCFYQDIILTVDTIPGAVYTWYKKTSPVDSVLLDSGLAYHLPFFVPEQTGLYVCKVNVNDGCLTRVSSINLSGECYMGVLSAVVQLTGKKAGTANQLSWNNGPEKGVIRYVIERRQAGEGRFVAIGTLPAHPGDRYIFTDNNFGVGAVEYRLQLVYANKAGYSNTLVLSTASAGILVYPNPVKHEFRIALPTAEPADYRVELLSASGQLVFATQAKNSAANLRYTRSSHLKAGIYLLRITNTTTNRTDIRKLVFE